MSHQIGMPHVILKAKTEPPKTQFFDLSKDDDERVEEFRSAMERIYQIGQDYKLTDDINLRKQ